MEKRAFLAVILSIAVFYIFSIVAGPEKKQVPPTSAQKAAPAAAAPAGAPTAAQGVTAVPPQSAPTAAIKKDVIVETSLYTAIFSSQGGSLKSLTLKKYREQITPSANQVV